MTPRIAAEDGARSDRGAQPDLADYLRLLGAWRVTLVACTVVAMTTTLLITQFVMVKKYRASALLHPLAQQNSVSQLAGGLAEGAGLGFFMGALGGSGERAEEYMAMMRSYAFTTSLIEQNHLATEILTEVRGRFFQSVGDVRLTPWKLFKIMSARFYCEYNLKTGGLSLSFVDRDPAQARTILKHYIDNLREKLRKQETDSAGAAVAALEDEAGQTSDSLLRNELYTMIAKQIQRQKLAQVQADFAFSLIEPPVVPDQPYSPQPLLDVVLSGVLTPLLLGALILLRAQFSGRLRVLSGDA